MEIFTKMEEIWQLVCQKTEPFRQGCAKVLRRTGKVLKKIWFYVYKLRGLLLTAPVIIGAVILACYNYTNLPESVGLNLLSTGEFETMVGRGTAVLVPLGLTGICVVLTLCSRKTLYPWLISVFSLVLPLLIYVTNVYPV